MRARAPLRMLEKILPVLVPPHLALNGTQELTTTRGASRFARRRLPGVLCGLFASGRSASSLGQTALVLGKFEIGKSYQPGHATK